MKKFQFFVSCCCCFVVATLLDKVHAARIPNTFHGDENQRLVKREIEEMAAAGAAAIGGAVMTGMEVIGKGAKFENEKEIGGEMPMGMGSFGAKSKTGASVFDAANSNRKRKRRSPCGKKGVTTVAPAERRKRQADDSETETSSKKPNRGGKPPGGGPPKSGPRRGGGGGPPRGPPPDDDDNSDSTSSRRKRELFQKALKTAIATMTRHKRAIRESNENPLEAEWIGHDEPIRKRRSPCGKKGVTTVAPAERRKRQADDSETETSSKKPNRGGKPPGGGPPKGGPRRGGGGGPPRGPPPDDDDNSDSTSSRRKRELFQKAFNSAIATVSRHKRAIRESYENPLEAEWIGHDEPIRVVKKRDLHNQISNFAQYLAIGKVNRKKRSACEGQEKPDAIENAHRRKRRETYDPDGVIPKVNQKRDVLDEFVNGVKRVVNKVINFFKDDGSETDRVK